MDDFDDERFREGLPRDGRDSGDFHRTPNDRVYEHDRCRGQTTVSGGDFAHLCDPFWPCTGTYCCTCAGFANLNDVRWTDTGELLSDYRGRLRRETPWVVMFWRFGGGMVVGGLVGALLGFLAAVIVQVPEDKRVKYAMIGAMVASPSIFVIGAFVLQRVCGIDYRRKR